MFLTILNSDNPTSIIDRKDICFLYNHNYTIFKSFCLTLFGLVKSKNWLQIRYNQTKLVIILLLYIRSEQTDVFK